MTEKYARILVVDDDPDMRELLRRRLTTPSEVLTADHGQEALNLIRQTRLDLVITGVMMPEVDAIALVRRLREDPATSSLPILMLTALNTSEDRASGLDIGADDDMGKPIDFAEPLARVKSLLRRSHRGRDAREIPILTFALPTLLQMLQMERKSCLIQITADPLTGRLVLHDGEVVDAVDDTGTGAEAVYRMLSWPSPHPEIQGAEAVTAPSIDLPLSHLLLEAFRCQDEAGASQSTSLPPAEQLPAWPDGDDLPVFLDPPTVGERSDPDESTPAATREVAMGDTRPRQASLAELALLDEVRTMPAPWRSPGSNPRPEQSWVGAETGTRRFRFSRLAPPASSARHG